uniref:Transmembrane protein n=1 Tax=Medicago truncatula TaxID=3880 RepID=I3SVH9_MEDTR|nr:unknown [Medicago truncatula]
MFCLQDCRHPFLISSPVLRTNLMQRTIRIFHPGSSHREQDSLRCRKHCCTLRNIKMNMNINQNTSLSCIDILSCDTLVLNLNIHNEVNNLNIKALPYDVGYFMAVVLLIYVLDIKF